MMTSHRTTKGNYGGSPEIDIVMPDITIDLVCHCFVLAFVFFLHSFSSLDGGIEPRTCHLEG